MAAPVRPNATKAYLRTKWVFVPAIANVAAPTVTELTSASTLDVTQMFYASSAQPSTSTNLARSPRRVGDTASYEFVGESSETFGEVRYAFNPQGAAASDGKKAFEKFPVNTTGYLVRRLGIDRNTDIAVGQFVTVFPVEFGEQNEVTEGDGEGAEVAIAQMVAQTGPKSLNKAVVA